ncbi:MAG: helix-turn-helix domain-containing protein [Bacteroidota bacterium]
MDHLVSIVFSIGFALCGFIIFGLIKRKKSGLPQRLLITFWVFIFFIILTYYASLHYIVWLYVISYPFLNLAQIFIPVLIFLYCKSIFFKQDRFFWTNKIHLIPSLVFALTYTAPELINYVSDSQIFPHIEKMDIAILTLCKDIYGIVYFVFSIRLLRQVEGKLVHIVSELSEVQFTWLFKFVYTFFGVIAIDFLFSLAEFVGNYHVDWDGYIVVLLLVVSLVYLAYYGIQQVSQFIPEFLFEVKKKKVITQDFAALAKRLEQLMKEDKLYRTPNLSLRDLAEKMGTTDKNLSMMLNNHLKVTFYDLVNAYRIEEAKARLLSNDLEKYTVIGIGKMCGFSSKSSFYRVFKSETGLTPRDFIKREKNKGISEVYPLN